MQLEKLTEKQFHTVWVIATNINGYDKKCFQDTLTELKQKGLIYELLGKHINNLVFENLSNRIIKESPISSPQPK